MISGQSASDTPVYLLKVTLLYVHPPVWRRLKLRGDLALSDLHYAIQIAMGWTDSHLHEFLIGKVRYTEHGVEEEDASGTEDEAEALLSEVIHRAGDTFRYVYDFGDDWQHEVLVEKVLPPDPDLLYPVCTGGERACPPEDVGGPPGFERFVEAMADPTDPEHDDYLEWFGDEFDPESFSVDDANEMLREAAMYTSTVYTTEKVDFVVYTQAPPYVRFYLFRSEGGTGLDVAAHNGHSGEDVDSRGDERIGILMLSAGMEGFEGDLYLDRKLVAEEEIEDLVDATAELLAELDDLEVGGLLAVHWMEEIGVWDLPAD
jgi:hypothetical protein